MIRVRIELCPLGDTSKPQLLGEVRITKKPTGGYSVNLFKHRMKRVGRSIWQRGKVLDFAQQPLGPYELLWRALDAVRRLAEEAERRGERLTRGD
jgi:hypothetical protein